MSPGVQSIADLTTETNPTSGEIPPPLVGASTIVVGNSMYVFGGRLVSSRQMTNNLYVLDLTTLVWRRHIGPPDSTPAPQPRYFHSANTYKNHMVVFGGMSHSNQQQELCALDDVCLLNLTTMTWTYPEVGPSIFSPQPRYAHLAVTAQDKLIVMGGQDMANQYIKEINVLDLKTFIWIQGCPLEGQYGAYRSVACSPRPSDPSLRSGSPFSSMDESNIPVCVYSNYNFADVARDLQIFYPLRTPQFRDHSPDMSGASLPPGLRFPMGHLLGHHMILTGTYLTPTHRSFHIWALNLANLVWMRIDTGSTFSSGSWNRGVLGDDENSHIFYVLGHRDRDLLEDYNRRQVNFDHIATVDMEAFGIYLHPQSTCAPIAQELGLSMLNEPSMSDIELRWPWFGKLLSSENDKDYKALAFPESYPVALAFLQFVYTDHLMTAQQHQPHILSRLLILADMYNMPRLSQLATHALHQILTISTASMVYETAALTCRTALQIRALRVMINAKKMLQQQQQMLQDDQQEQRRPSHDQDFMIQRIPSQDSSEDPFGSPTLRKLATSKSSTTHDLSVTPIPRMSKSGTMLSTNTHPPTNTFRKGSVTTALHPSTSSKDRPNIGIRF
ncbi:hypothetical protein BJV82DRAFT_520211 [Fennellomyces sp. T-0311]|nr:hypothetical protein BJV82DRAFT_520211 [Fennellomyces sp. T-0311]